MLADHEISLASRPAGRPGPDQAGSKKAAAPRAVDWRKLLLADQSRSRPGLARPDC